MTYPSSDPTVQEYAARADEAERSPIPVFLKIGRVIVWIVYAIVLLTAILLLLAFFLRLAGANPTAGFVEWVYRSTDRAMEPFRGIFPTHEITDASVLDTSLLFAAVFYFVLALLVDIVLRWITHKLRSEERDIAQARAQADLVAQQAAARQHVADSAAQQAAAREYAAQQAAAQQYAIATAAAQEVVAKQSQYSVPAQPVRAKPAAPTAPDAPTLDPPVTPSPPPPAI